MRKLNFTRKYWPNAEDVSEEEKLHRTPRFPFPSDLRPASPHVENLGSLGAGNRVGVPGPEKSESVTSLFIPLRGQNIA